MAHILTPTNLVNLEPSVIKHLPSSAELTCPLPSTPSSIVWSPEANSAYVSLASGDILQYDMATSSFQNTYLLNDQCSGHHNSLLCKDRGKTLLYARGQNVIVFSTHSGKPSHVFDTHKTTVTSLSLSNDTTLLASTSTNAIHVHNLTLASHTVLRGIPSGHSGITTCVFHPHSRTRLLVGLGAQLLVYDTTRPSGPTKVITVDKDLKNVGSIVSIACSPFSKTLVAIGCSSGMICLVDLEKEKSLFRSVTMSAPLTCLTFSAEGAALYAGTENGKFLVLDLRALDKPPTSLSVSENGDRVIAIAVQKKLKPGDGKTAATKPPLVQRDTNKTAPGASRISATVSAEATRKADKGTAKFKPGTLAPAAATPRRVVGRSASAASQPSASPTGRAVSGPKRVNSGVVKSPLAVRSKMQMKAFSPPKVSVTVPDSKSQVEDEGDLSIRVENLLALPKGKDPAPVQAEPPVSAALKGPTALSRASSRAHLGSGKPHTHTRTASASSDVVSESASSAFPRVRSASSSSVASRMSSLSARGAARTASTSPTAVQNLRRVSGASAVSRMSRTPSPDLPGMEDDGPITPIPAYKGKRKDGAVLGLGTPEIDEWIKAGQGNANAMTRQSGKRVGFAGEHNGEADSDSDSDSDREVPSQPASGSNTHVPQAESLAMQVSPRRTFAGTARASAGWAAVPSPLRNSAAPQSPQARAAQDMLQALLRDALHDFRQETKGEIVGLHLDLIRMGTSWRREMREAMGEFAEEMRALREDNARLREENERLRRGY